MKETTHVALCEVTIRLFAIESLKVKRGIKKSAMARLRNRFNVSIAEVRFLDSRELIGLALAGVSNSRKVLDGLFSDVLTFLEQDLRLVVEDFSLTHL